MKRHVAFVTGVGFTVLLGLSLPAQAHHGWGWYGGEPFELTGLVEDANMGGPHGTLKLRVDGELWDVVLAPPGRNTRAGLENDIVQVGMEVTAQGHRWQDDAGRLEMKTERLIVAGRTYDLYPERD
ncbi:MAG: hypothetical protein RJB62_992 [Pseudomonadota bacterium]|jgi:hypothetical protein